MRSHIETDVHIFYFRKNFLYGTNQIIISGFNDNNSDTSVVRSQTTKHYMIIRKTKKKKINARTILITEWNQKCNEKLQIPFSIGVIMVTTPWFCVLVGSMVSWQPVAISCGGQLAYEGCGEWCCVFV